MSAQPHIDSHEAGANTAADISPVNPPIAHSLSPVVEVADENYPKHGYAANATNALNLQDTAVPEPR